MSFGGQAEAERLRAIHSGSSLPEGEGEMAAPSLTTCPAGLPCHPHEDEEACEAQGANAGVWR